MRNMGSLKRGFESVGPALILFLVLTLSAFAAETEEKQPEKAEAESLVASYYEALSQGEQEQLEELWEWSSPEKLAWVLRQNEVRRECGQEGYELTAVTAWPMQKEGTWLVLAEYELAIKDIAVKVPGAESFLLQKSGEGWQNASDSESLAQEVMSMLEETELAERMMTVNQAYNETVLEEPKLLAWLEDVAEKLNGQLWESLTGEPEHEAEHPESAPEETSTGDAVSGAEYVVKQGDCLWRIADRELGDGSLWTELYEKNRSVIGENPDFLLIGTKLSLY